MNLEKVLPHLLKQIDIISTRANLFDVFPGLDCSEEERLFLVRRLGLMDCQLDLLLRVTSYIYKKKWSGDPELFIAAEVSDPRAYALYVISKLQTILSLCINDVDVIQSPSFVTHGFYLIDVWAQYCALIRLIIFGLEAEEGRVTLICRLDEDLPLKLYYNSDPADMEKKTVDVIRHTLYELNCY